MNVRVFVLFVLGVVAGCTPFDREGHLRSVKDGSRVELVLRNSPATGGTANATFPSGERCSGELRTVPDAPRDAFGEERAQRGILVLRCEGGRIIRCDFVREATGPGAGTCTDSAHVGYVLAM